MAYGRWRVRVPVEPAREHVERLVEAGLRYTQIGPLAGVSRGTIRNILLPETVRIAAHVEQAVLAVPIPTRPGDVVEDNALVPVFAARRRIRALIAHGYSQTYLARQLGMPPAHAVMSVLVERKLRAGATGQYITASRERAIKALFDQLQMIPGPSDQAREYARERGWALPFEWDEEALDDPNGTPMCAKYRRESREGDRTERSEKAAERRSRVAELTAEGLSAAEIAVRLGISQRTVVRDRGHIPGWEKAS